MSTALSHMETSIMVQENNYGNKLIKIENATNNFSKNYQLNWGYKITIFED